MNKPITPTKRSFFILIFLNFIFLSVSGQTNFSGLGPANSGGSGFKSVAGNSNIVVSNNTAQDLTDIYLDETGMAFTTASLTIKADGQNAESFQFNELSFYGFTYASLTTNSKLIFKDKNGNVLQTMGLTGSKTMPNRSIISKASTFFTSNNTTPINNVASIEFVYQANDGGPDDLTLTSLSISNIVAPGSCDLEASITSKTNISCNGEKNGALTVSASGGTPMYSYSWSNGSTTSNTSSTTNSISNLTNGNYSVTITDSNGCKATVATTITEPSSLTANATATDVSCNEGNDGTVDLTVTGGTAPYTYAWNNTATTEDMIGLTAATYSVTVTDANGCTATESVDVLEPATLVASAAATDVSCNGGDDGAVDLTVTGGTAPYTYAWNNTATTEDMVGLKAATYSVTVTDANGCTATELVTVSEPTAIGIATSTTDVSSNGGNDGKVTTTVTGGTAPYTYAWNNTATTKDLTGVTAGTYAVTVTDANGCTATKSVEVKEPAALEIKTNIDRNVSCNGGSDGKATANVNGGTAPYAYLWSNGASTAIISRSSCRNLYNLYHRC